MTLFISHAYEDIYLGKLTNQSSLDFKPFPKAYQIVYSNSKHNNEAITGHNRIN